MKYARKVKEILRLLNRAYGKPAPLRKSDPIDELIRTILSQNTSDRNSWRAFGILKNNFKSWDGLLRADVRRISRLIRHAGLANIKARRIKDILIEIKRREGSLSLSSLKDLTIKDSLGYLRSLKGVGPKTAACVLLFSFKMPAMPVDTHIFRVSKRLGLIDKGSNIEEAHELLSRIAPKGLTLRPFDITQGRYRARSRYRQGSGSSRERLSSDLIYDFHLGIIEHGRRTCKARNPKCALCVLYRLCEYESKAFFKRRS